MASIACTVNCKRGAIKHSLNVICRESYYVNVQCCLLRRTTEQITGLDETGWFLTFFYFLLCGALAVVKFDYRDGKFLLPWPKAKEQGRQYWRIRDRCGEIKPDISLSSLKLCVRFMGSSSYGTATEDTSWSKGSGFESRRLLGFFLFPSSQ